VRDFADLVDRDEKLALGLLEECRPGRLRLRLVERAAELVCERGEALLCAVVDVALDAAAFDVGCLDQPRPRPSNLVCQ
jgi:hypothetical protein